MVTQLFHSKAGVLHQLNQSPERANPKMTRRIQMKPVSAKTFSLEGFQIYGGNGQKAALLQVLAAGAQKREWVFEVFDHLPASDGRSLLRLQRGKKLLIQGLAQAPFRLVSGRGFRFKSGDP